MPSTPFIGVRISWLTVARKGRLGLVGALGLTLGVERRVAGQTRLVVGDLQTPRQVFFLVGERDVCRTASDGRSRT